MKTIILSILLILFSNFVSAAIVHVDDGDELVYRTISDVDDSDGKFEILNPANGKKEMGKREVSYENNSVSIADVDLNNDEFDYEVGQVLDVDGYDGVNDFVPPVRADRMYCTFVERKEDVTVPAGTFKDCFKIVHMTVPDQEVEWQCPSVGLVKSEYIHHGSLGHELVELVKVTKKRGGRPS